MSTKTHSGSSTTSIACAPGALPGGLTRTRFFDGMFLTQADLENEQRYWRMKRRLTNRALGAGIAWGLRLVWDAQRARFVLSPGYALDCCGNDLVAEGTREFTARELWDRADPSLRAPDPRNPQRARRAGVVLQYVECAEEARPVHRDACAGPTSSCETARIRETARLVLVPPPAPLPPTPIGAFIDELEQFADGLPSDIRERLFPGGDPPAEPVPGTQPDGAQVPLTVRARVPASPGDERLLQPVVGSTVYADTLYGGQPGRTAVFTLELQPRSGWGFASGEVRESGRVVETVSPPLAMSMFWSINVVLPPETSPTDGSTVHNFQFDVVDLGLEQMFGPRRRGIANLTIEGAIVVQANWNGGVQVSVEKLRVQTRSSTVIEEGERPRCFDELLPWGLNVSPERGGDSVKVVLLGALYAFLSESTSAQPGLRRGAEMIYVIAWYLLFGANIVANVPDQYRAQLAILLRRVFERWCAGFVYPGPRCSDEHHGVYLGSVEVTESGQIQSFDMWDYRRHVLTGPLITHWARQFDIAPIDVIVGRFADALCCVASGTLPVPPPVDDNPSDDPSDNPSDDPSDDPSNDRLSSAGASFTRPGHALAAGPMLIGPVRDITATARRRWPSVVVRSGTWAEVVGQVVQLFMSSYSDSYVREVITASIPGGGTIGVIVPDNRTFTLSRAPSTAASAATVGDAAASPAAPATSAPATSAVRTDVLTALRSGKTRATARAREPLADFVVALANDTPVEALGELPGAAGEVAKRFAERAITVGKLLELGPDTAFVRVWASPEESGKLRDGLDAVFDAAEGALDRMTAAAASSAGAGFSRATLTDAAFHERASAALRKGLGALDPKLVAAAARRASGQGR